MRHLSRTPYVAHMLHTKLVYISENYLKHHNIIAQVDIQNMFRPY